MRTILIASQKGGVGKSTLAIHFAAIADNAKAPALLIDADQQGSAAFWFSRREAPTPLLAQASPNEVAGILQDATSSGIATTIIDSAPHDAAGLQRLMGLADFVVIVAGVGVLDLAAVASTLGTAQRLGIPHAILLSRTPPPRGEGEPSIVTEARAALEGTGAVVLRSAVAQRASLAHSLINGGSVHEFEPDGRAANEIAAAFNEILQMMKKRKR